LAANAAGLNCVLEVLGSRIAADSVQALWYERPYHLTSGEPVPIGVMFSIPLTWSQVQLVASHPFVDNVEPVPGSATSLGVPAPSPPVECPLATDTAMPKLQRATILQGQGRQPAVIEIKDVGLLPEAVSCSDKSACQMDVTVLWERTILNTRHRTCLNRWIDAALTAGPTMIGYNEIVGTALGPPLPPFGQSTYTTKSFGLGITWDDAVLIAKHPYVESVWSTVDLMRLPPAMPNCSPDLSSPLPMTRCPMSLGSAAGKILASDVAALQGPGVHSVMISVIGGARICPLPACATSACPERDQVITRWEAENLESQHCVRELITSIGGASSPDTLWLINAFTADLTWDEIQTVAAHPQVGSIESTSGGAPP
jgi:hypothetical protein